MSENKKSRVSSIKKKRLSLGVIFTYLEKYGGAERYLLECLRFWQHNHDITLYASKINISLLREHGVTAAVKTVELTPSFVGEYQVLLNGLLLPQIWRQEIGKHDIYNCHVWPNQYIDVHPMVWLCHEPLRSIYDLRFEQTVNDVSSAEHMVRNLHIYPKKNYDSIGNNQVAEATLNVLERMDKTTSPEKTVANSMFCAKYVKEVFGQEIVEVVYPGVDQTSFPILPKDKNLFVTVSQLWPHKRVRLLLEAIALTDDAQLIIIGSGPLEENLSSISKEMGIEDRIFILSGINNKELSLIMGRASAFLFSPLREPFGIVVLEAMAAGLPIIGVNEGGFVEVCKPEFSFLTDSHPEKFAEKIRFIQSNPDVAAKMGMAAKKESELYSWRRTAAELEKIIEKTYAENFEQFPDAFLDEAPLVGIQYHLWYQQGFGSAHWNDNIQFSAITDKPTLGFYGSSTGETIQAHFQIFEEMEIDYVILNVHIDENGVNGNELIAIDNLFRIAERSKSSLRFAFQIAFYGDDPLNNIDILATVVDKRYSTRPNYLQVEGRPVLFIFWNTAFDGNQKAIEKLKKVTQNFINIAASLRISAGTNERKKTMGFFEGFSAYSPLELASEENWETVWLHSYEEAERAGMRYSCATISPGYDDTALIDPKRENNPFRVISRNNGETFQRTMNFVKSLPERPQFINITSFNEFHENTHIEPSINNGKQYVEITKAFVREIKIKIETTNE